MSVANTPLCQAHQAHHTDPSRPQRLIILTGASRGLGAAMAQRLLMQPGTFLIALSRQPDMLLPDWAQQHGSACEQWSVDLADAVSVAQRLSDWLAAQPAQTWTQAALINNAGVISRLGPVEESAAMALANALRVGLEAPMLLTAAFLAGTQGWSARVGGEIKVLNISSGLGRRAMAGSASYCAAKAGMDHFTRAVALEQAQQPHPARLVSLAPGVIDTDMQVQLREGDPQAFPDRSRFVHLHEAGLLDSPDAAAQKVLAWLARADFGAVPVADVREA